jgi:hypothetical protein
MAESPGSRKRSQPRTGLIPLTRNEIRRLITGLTSRLQAMAFQLHPMITKCRWSATEAPPLTGHAVLTSQFNLADPFARPLPPPTFDAESPPLQHGATIQP